jgi:PQQ-dependent dehydrogenase (methanol/ethanol family)
MRVVGQDLELPVEIKWKYNASSVQDAVPMACCDLVNRGPAYAGGKLFVTTLDNHVIAIDAKTGKELWKVQNGNYTSGETITMSPLVVGDKVIVGNSGGEYGVRGSLTAYGIGDGRVVWRAYGTGPDKDVLIDPRTTLMMGKPIGEADLGVKSWPAGQWQHGGASAWGWISYDPELNLIYYGTSNPGAWNPNQRPGDNKWSTSIFARDPNTGLAKWVFQLTPHDEWDYDAVNENILADLNIDGRQRKTLVHLDRNGFGYTIDRESGIPLVAEKYDPVVNCAERIVLSIGAPVRVKKYSTSQGVDNNVMWLDNLMSAPSSACTGLTRTNSVASSPGMQRLVGSRGRFPRIGPYGAARWQPVATSSFMARWTATQKRSTLAVAMCCGSRNCRPAASATS